jgi:hypothetical protein
LAGAGTEYLSAEVLLNPYNVLVSAESRELMQKILASNSSQGEAKPKPKPQCRVPQKAKPGSYFLLFCTAYFATSTLLAFMLRRKNIQNSVTQAFFLFLRSRIFFKKQQLTSSIHESGKNFTSMQLL